MTKQGLDILKRENEKNYQLLLKNIELLQQNPIVKDYLANQIQLNYLKEYQEYLNKLEIGEDDIVFEKKNQDINKNYGLVFFINCALSLKYYGSDQEYNTGLFLKEEELLSYLENAEQVLRTTKKYEGDQLADNPYNIEIYKNLSHITILNNQEIKDFFKLFDKNSNSSYQILDKYQFPRIIILKIDKKSKETSFLVLARNISKLNLINPQTLTKREQDAFFGLKAQEILGVQFTKEEKFKDLSNK